MNYADVVSKEECFCPMCGSLYTDDIRQHHTYRRKNRGRGKKPLFIVRCLRCMEQGTSPTLLKQWKEKQAMMKSKAPKGRKKT